MSQSRQLAAIMFTDIVGYTKLMGESELQAFTLLEKSRNIQRPLVEQYHGKWLKEMGDGVLVSFSSVSDAVYCAKAIQEASKSINGLMLRIGIHQGEVVFDGEDVFGDGVNIASRLEPLAPPGGIMISGSVQLNILNKDDLDCVFVGERSLKNVGQKIKVYQIITDGETSDMSNAETVSALSGSKSRKVLILMAFLLLCIMGYFLYSTPGDEQSEVASPYMVRDKTIAVLPFDNISNDPDQEYFSDGMTEEILNHLVKIGDLKVTSRTSTLQYKETQKPVKEIASELKVAHILEGSVRKAGDDIRITVQLIDAVADQHLWSETYDRKFVQIFDIQSDVAKHVATALNARLTPNVIESIDQAPTQNMEAYEIYLRALNGLQAITAQGNIEYIKMLKTAIALDSDFSSAYALLGNYIIFEAGFAGDKNSKEIASEARKALETALLLNPLDGIAHAMMGPYLLWYEQDFKGAEIELLAAQRLAPSNSQAYHFLIDLYMATGRYQEAVEVGNTIISLEDGPLAWARMTLALSFNSELEAMEAAIQKAIKADDDDLLVYTEISRAYLIQQQYSKIPATLDMAPDTKNIPRGMGLLAIAYDKMSESGESEIWLDKLKERSAQTTGGSPLFYTAMVYASRGEAEQAFQWLEKSFEANEIELYWLKVEPEFASLHEDPRWQEMLDRIGFP